MSRKKSQNTKEILDRLKKALNVRTDTDLAKYLGVKQNTISTWKSRNSFDYKLIFSICDENNIDIDWLLTGEGEMFRKKDGNTQIAEGDGINQIIGSNNRNSININVNKKAFAQNLDSIVPNKEAIEVINLIIEGHYTPNIISDCLKKLRKIKEATESDE